MPARTGERRIRREQGVKVVIAGGSGWLGSALCRSFATDRHEAVVLSRSRRSPAGAPGSRSIAWDGRTLGDWADEIDGADAIVNFAGESIAQGRWNAERKRSLRASRVEPTAVLVQAIERARRRPAVLANASAVGYYGDRGDETVTERDPPGSDFLARLVIDWEAAAQRAADLGVRVVLLRQGVVLGSGGGALPRITLPFRLFVGGPIGSGMQWVSWVHIEDVVGLFRLAIDCPDANGPMNVTAPEPVRYRDFAAAVGRALGRPSWLPVPPLGLRAALGELAEALLAGQRACPAVAQRLGYTFREADLDRALHRALKSAA